MENLKTLAKLLGLIIFGLIIGSIVFFFAFWFFIAFLIAVGLFSVVWAVGVPITIKESGVKVGYVRWFTYYPVNNTRNY